VLAPAAAGSVLEMGAAFIDSVFLAFPSEEVFVFALVVVRRQLAAWK
jgi:hypothetical protein